MKNRWLWWNKWDLKSERQQLVDEGRNIGSLEAEFTRLAAESLEENEQFQHDVNELFDKARALPIRSGYPYIEPSDLPSIKAHRAAGPRVIPLDVSEDVRRDRIAGAWMGRCAGCLLGKPVEGIKRPQLQRLMERAGCRDIPDYLWRLPGMTERDYRDVEFGYLWDFFWETDCFPGDDDTNYTVAGMALLKQKGIDFTPTDMGQFWLANIPVGKTCTAERVAYRNFVNNIDPPESAIIRNPYRELIGAQIRTDVFGYVALGRPELAAELAWRDGSISHVKNGIYGSMWVAAMLATAVTQTDIRRIVEISLTEIPQRSRLFEAVMDILNRHADGLPYADMVDFIHRRWDENHPHHWCHTLSNAQIVTIALLYGEGDYEKAIARAVLPCFDTDCNGATVGSVMGMLVGAKALPDKWTGVMNDTLRTDLQGYQTASIRDLSEDMFQLHKKLL